MNARPSRAAFSKPILFVLLVVLGYLFLTHLKGPLAIPLGIPLLLLYLQYRGK